MISPPSRNRLLVLCISLILPIFLLAEEHPHFSIDLEPAELAVKLINSMDSEELIGQTLMFGYAGTETNKNILSWIENRTLGSVRLSGANINSLQVLRKTIQAYQSTASASKFGIPLLVATDQEGGVVRHIKEITATPGNIALGADPIPADSMEIGRIIGQELNGVGINMNFAPVIDLFTNPKSEIVGSRAFSDNPYWTGILGLAFSKGQQEFGVISTAKHYPGHGDTDKDSHGTLPIINSSKEELINRDLIPYNILIRGGVPAIMAGHLAFPNVTGNTIPASLSKSLLTDLLKKEMGFTGVVITDDLFMRGARASNKPLHEIAYRSLMAGADIILISQEQDHNNIINRFLREMKNDPLFGERVRDAATRILAMKAQWLKKPSDSVDNEINNAEIKEFLLTHSARSITLIKDYYFPIPPDKAGDTLLIGNYTLFFSAGRNRYPNADFWQIEYSQTRADYKQQGKKLALVAHKYDTLIALVQNSQTAVIFNELKNFADKVVLMSIYSPSSLIELPWAKTSMAIYGTNQESFQSAFAALVGDFRPEGQLPVSLKF